MNRWHVWKERLEKRAIKLTMGAVWSSWEGKKEAGEIEMIETEREKTIYSSTRRSTSERTWAI